MYVTRFYGVSGIGDDYPTEILALGEDTMWDEPVTDVDGIPVRLILAYDENTGDNIWTLQVDHSSDRLVGGRGEVHLPALSPLVPPEEDGWYAAVLTVAEDMGLTLTADPAWTLMCTWG